MVDEIRLVADELMAQRETCDPLTEARKEILPYQRRVADALGALRAIVTDDTPSAQLTSDLRVIHGLVAALVGSRHATQLIQKLPSIRHLVATDLEAAYHGDPSASSYGEIIAAYPSTVAVSTYRLARQSLLGDASWFSAQDRDPIPGFLAVACDVVSERLERLARKLLVGELQLL